MINIEEEEEEEEEDLLYNHGNHMSNFFSAANSFRDAGVLTDVVLKLKGLDITAHRLILSTCSGYFKSMFTSNMMETHQDIVEMHEEDVETFQSLIDYCYTGTIKISRSNVEQLLTKSVLYQITTLEDACEGYLLKQLDDTCFIKLLNLSDAYNCEKLYEKTMEFTKHNFLRLSKQADFKDLPFKYMDYLLSCGDLRVISEQQVYEALRVWLSHDLPNRLTMFEDLIAHIRFPLLPMRYVMLCVAKDTVVAGIPKVQELISACQRYHLLPQDEHTFTPSHFILREGRKTTELGRMYIFGGINDQQKNTETYEYFDSGTKKWAPGGPLLNKRSASCATLYEGIIYLAGGLGERHKPLASMDTLCVLTGQWEASVPMLQARSVFGLNALQGQLYALGGHVGDSYTKSVEVFNPVRGCWLEAAPLLTQHGCFSSVILEENIYCMGGFSRSNEYEYSSVVERYDPRIGKWSFTAPLTTARAAHQAVVIGDIIYVFGGTSSNGFNVSVEWYEPRVNKWTFLDPRPNLSSTCMCIGNVGGMVWIAGGRNPSSEQHEAVDYMIGYNVQDNTWNYISHMREKRMFACSVVVD